VFRSFDALTAGTVEIRARARIKQGARRRWVGTLKGKREVPAAGRHRVRAIVTKKGRRLARDRRSLPLELRLSFTDLAGRSLWATSELTLKR
jgi:KaiC/GvpD/RAD55 family RecA-like ATPase